MSRRIGPVRTNILLGAELSRCKLLSYLLQQKPADQRWSVLDNGGAAAGPDPQSQEVHITRLAGGCLCCAGVNLRVTLTRLLRQERPQRLLVLPAREARIEDVLRLLGDAWLGPVLEIRSLIGALALPEWEAWDQARRAEELALLQPATILAIASESAGGLEEVQELIGLLQGEPVLRILGHGKAGVAGIEGLALTDLDGPGPSLRPRFYRGDV
jgi:hypothetical protein